VPPRKSKFGGEWDGIGFRTAQATASEASAIDGWVAGSRTSTVGRWRLDRLSSQRLLATPGSGMHERLALPGLQVITELKLATGSCAAKVNEASTVCGFQRTSSSKTFSPSNGAPYPKLSSMVPTMGAAWFALLPLLFTRSMESSE
jgi:hypothetical protein